MDGMPRKIDFNTLRKSMSRKDGFKILTAADLTKTRERRYENHQKHDYEVLPNGTRGKGKTVYRPRKRK